MSELVLLTLGRSDTNDLAKRARKGDADAQARIDELWRDYQHESLECFLCPGVVRYPPNTLFLPEHHDFSKIVAAPICEDCWRLPSQVRWSRAMRVLKAMFGKTHNGKQVHYSFTKRRRRF